VVLRSEMTVCKWDAQVYALQMRRKDCWKFQNVILSVSGYCGS